MANLRPSPPSNVEIGGVPETPDLITNSTGTLTISAEMNDPDGDRVRMMVRISPTRTFASSRDLYSPFVASGDRASITFNGLRQNTHYYARVYARDEHGAWARNATAPYAIAFNSIDFWTNRPPDAPVLVLPVENAAIDDTTNIGFDWTFSDPDPGDTQVRWQLRWRTAPTLTSGPGPYTTIGLTSGSTSHTVTAGPFVAGRSYEWQVRVSDGDLWSEWSAPFSFYSYGASDPPVPVAPIGGAAWDVSDPPLFRWRFIVGTVGDTQKRADLRYRLVGQDDSDWITVLGADAPGVPGAARLWSETTGTYTPGEHYEWQVRTYGTISGLASDWSRSATFWAVSTPGEAAIDLPVEPSEVISGSLGCGEYRVFIYEQGGQVVHGEFTPFSSLEFSRKRDDISHCLIDSNGFSADCCELFANLRCWAHELVVFRNGVRVWEGPITRITYTTDSVQVEAKDVMAYLYRRIMRQGYDDSFQMISPTTGLRVSSGGIQLGLHTVVERAEIIAMNALAPYDPNLLPYLTAYHFADDARQSRVVPDYAQTAWEQIDDLAANAGLDYTVVGRRIMLWDTHRAIGRLSELRDGDFNSPPIVTEYGMQMCNYSAVTNGTGIWGAATPEALEGQDPFQYFGPVEMLNSAFNESATDTETALTPAGRVRLVRTLESQAARNINHRWPNPVVVRVPDNSTLNPEIGITFDQLVPGVWIPLRSTGTCRDVSQWQKLDSVTVIEGPGGERVNVVMSPAPNGGLDPDSAGADGGDGGGGDT